jgi:hypothetical protein
VKLLWKKLQLGVFAGLTLLATGCGGFNAKYGISPLSFLLPGLVKAESKPAKAENKSVINTQSKELAQTQTLTNQFPNLCVSHSL